MKKKLTIIRFLILMTITGFVNYSTAQHIYVGARYLPTISSLKIQDDKGAIKADAALTHGVEGLIGFGFNEFVGLQAEVMYSKLAQKYSINDFERKIELHYVNIPLLLSLNTGRTRLVNFNVVAGPQIGVNVGSKIIDKGAVLNGIKKAQVDVRKNDFGVAYGAGIDIPLFAIKRIRFEIGYRGVIGLIDISQQDAVLETNSYYILQKKRSNSYSAYAGLTFIL